MSEPTSKLSKSDPSLMRFAANAADYGSLITDRWDLVVRAGRGLGHGAPACFIPATAEIELDADECGQHDAYRLKKVGWTLGVIDMVKPTHRNLIPVTTGAFAHECGHSLYSLWMNDPAIQARMAKEPDQVVKLAIALEEGRQELRLTFRDKSHESVLEAAFGSIILPNMKKIPDDDAFAILHAMALTFYRTEFHSPANYAYRCAERAFRRLTGKPFDARRRLPDSSTDTNSDMLDMARDWWNQLPESAKDETPNGGNSHSCHSDDSESGDGDGESDIGSSMSAIAKEFDADMKKNAKDAVASATDSEKSVGGTDASKRSKGAAGFTGRGSGADNGSGVKGSRDATAEEMAAARKLARVLQAAQTVARVKSPKRLPPGRIRGRAAVKWSRDRSMGVRTDAALFKGKTKGDTLPPIRVGIGLDVSSSMSHMAPLAASLGWTIASASWDVNALVSAVCFGSSIMPYAEVGKAFKRVKTLGAESGEEAVGDACEFLDNQVELLNGDGPRILVIISDCLFVNDIQRAKGAKFAQEFVKSGGHLLYIGKYVPEYSSSSYERYYKGWPELGTRNVYSAGANLVAVAQAVGRIVRRVYDGS